MTPDERNMLSDLANRIAQTPAPPKDPDAEEFIRTHIGNRPDALYLMTQTVLIQNMALQQAQQQLAQLQGRGTQSSSSFLGGSRPNYGSAPSGGYSAPQPQQPQYSTGGASFAGAPSGQPSFLRGAAQTAAGVAAGALAFEGIRDLFGGHSGYGGGGLFGGGGDYMGGAPQEEIVNNYYDSPGGGNDFGSNDGGNFQDDNFDSGSDFGDGGGGGGFDDNFS